MHRLLATLRGLGRNRLLVYAFIGMGVLLTTAAGCELSESQRFESVEPCRLGDTRQSSNPNITPVNANVRRVQVAGVCGVAGNATSAAVTLTVLGSSGNGYFVAYPSDMDQPNTSSLNWVANEIRSNMTLTGLGDDGSLLVYSSRADAELIIDVNGAFVEDDSSRDGRYEPVAQRRIVPASAGAIAANSTLNVGRPPEVPSDALAVMINVTSTGHPASTSFLTAYAPDTALPTTSFLNSMPNASATAAATIVPITADGFVIYSKFGATVRVDLLGYFTGDSAAESDEGLFIATTPTRLVDTRTHQAPGLFDGGTKRILDGFPVRAVATNYTVVSATESTFLATFPGGTTRPSTTSTVNAMPGRATANYAVEYLSNRGVDVYASKQTHVIVDATGFFTGAPFTVSNPVAISNNPADPLRPVTSPDVGTECAGGLSAANLNTFFAQNIDTMTGVDYQRATRLPDGRVLWVFQDAFLNTGSGSKLVHNVGAIQSGRCFTLLHGGTTADPTSWIERPVDEHMQRWLWPLGGEVSFDEGTFRLILADMEEEAEGSYLDDTEPLGTVMVDIALPSLSPGPTYVPVHSSDALYGFSVTSDASYSYLYAQCHQQFGFDDGGFAEHGECSDEIYVARVPRGELYQAPEYWAGGQTWSPSAGAAQAIVTTPTTFNPINPGQVIWDGDEFLMTNKAGDWWGRNVQFWSSPNPQGPWTLYDSSAALPSTCAATSVCNNYFSSWIPWRNPNGNMIFGWSNNTWPGQSSPNAYRPMFSGVINP